MHHKRPCLCIFWVIICLIFFLSVMSTPALDMSSALGRLPAEFEPIQGVIVTWADREPFYNYITKIIEHAVEATDVYIVVQDKNQEASTRGDLARPPNMDFEHLYFIKSRLETPWHRNYGAFGIHKADGSLAFLDADSSRYWRKQDDGVPVAEFFRAVTNGSSFLTEGTP